MYTIYVSASTSPYLSSFSGYWVWCGPFLGTLLWEIFPFRLFVFLVNPFKSSSKNISNRNYKWILSWFDFIKIEGIKLRNPIKYTSKLNLVWKSAYWLRIKFKIWTDFLSNQKILHTFPQLPEPLSLWSFWEISWMVSLFQVYLH